MTPPSWKDVVAEIVAQLPPQFELRDVLKHKPQLERLYPLNKHIDAKIRQTLQVLRDRGVITFEGAGRYVKCNTTPRFSPLIDFSAGIGFTSAAQIARLVLETWAEFNLYCLNCESDTLTRLTANTPVADFKCVNCKSKYQVKGKDGRFGRIIPGAAYQPTLDAVRAGSCPHYVLLEYDRRFCTVVFGKAVFGAAITEDRIIARAALKQDAKRAGWIGCSVSIEGLPAVSIVEPGVVDPGKARAEWSAALATTAPEI
ncbi:MAG: hypothetical protein M3R51_07960 [Candidatus Eremiobacteraeota bacterium]|nr:hypothetical protein [Candidatus Eremiobacteraeota bacterium]